MLVRVIVKNLFSFKEHTEFNMLPGRFNRFPGHVYCTAGKELLKLNAMYGANGAGKSNLVRAIALLKTFLKTGEMPAEFITQTFRFDVQSREHDIYLGVEFVKNERLYYYDITINQGIVVSEELQLSDTDTILFSRTDRANENDLRVFFSEEITGDREASLFPEFLSRELLARNQPVMYYLKARQSAVFEPYKSAYDWLVDGLTIITPNSQPKLITMMLEVHSKFSEFVNDVMRAYSTGVSKIEVETSKIEDYFGEGLEDEAEQITAQLRSNPAKPILGRKQNREVVFLSLIHI
ncbi:MAG: hypothetical protein EBZ77_12145 [Chitinophagia bacterium]|nr:hypothetical protein [Chitinophagia bacterium]